MNDCYSDSPTYFEKISGGGTKPRYLGVYATKAELDAAWPESSLGAGMAGSTATIAGVPSTYQPGVGWVAQSSVLKLAGGAVLIGDSHHALSGGDTPVTTSYTANKVRGWVTWLQIATGYKMPILANLAVGGTRVDQIALTVDSALEYKPSVVFDSSFTNDMVQGYDANTSLVDKSVYLDKILASGASLVLFVAPPFGGMTETQISGLLLHYQWCKNYAAKNKNVFLADAFAFFVDPTSATLASKPGMLIDTWHLTAQSARNFALDFLAKSNFTRFIPEWMPPFLSIYDKASASGTSIQLNDNPGLLGSVAQASAGISGNAPTHFAVTRTTGTGTTGTGTASCAVSSGAFGQDFTTTFSVSAPENFLRQISPNAATIAALRGKTFYIAHERTYSGMAGMCEDQISTYIDGKISTGLLYSTTIPSAALADNSDRTETVLTGPFICPSDAATIRINFNTMFGSSGGGAVTMRKLRFLDSGKMQYINRV